MTRRELLAAPLALTAAPVAKALPEAQKPVEFLNPVQGPTFRYLKDHSLRMLVEVEYQGTWFAPPEPILVSEKESLSVVRDKRGVMLIVKFPALGFAEYPLAPIIPLAPA